MRLLLRCDAGPSTGVGHAVRCAAIAEAAGLDGHDVFWSGRLDGLGWLWAGLYGWFAYDAPEVPVPPGTVLPAANSADELVDLCVRHRIDAVHVDHYLLGPDLRDRLNDAGVVLSSVEDFHTGRRPADVVVDPNLGADADPRPDDGSPVLLRGPRFAPLRESARRARIVRQGQKAVGLPARPGPSIRRPRTPADPPRVLVVMGGTDAAGLLGPVVDALAGTGVPADVDVVVPAGHTLDDVPDGFRTVPPLPDLPGAAADVDLVVSASGTTVWELCCVGVAMALVRAADNQTEGYRAVTGVRAAAGLGTAADLPGPSTTETLRRLLTDADARAALAARARQVVDGQGTARVLGALLQAVRYRGLTTRPATYADAAMLLGWRNDPETQRWSRKREAVPAQEHADWLQQSLDSGERMLLVMEDDRGPVGTVRWDLESAGWEVSITLAPDRRGAGLAGPVLTAGERALRTSAGPGVTVRAVVHRDNAASARLFAGAGYRPSGPADADGFGTHSRTLA